VRDYPAASKVRQTSLISFCFDSTAVDERWRAVKRVGSTQEPIIVAKTGWSETIPAFKWVNTVLGNVKTAICGTFHALRRHYVPRYFAEFQWRFNRRANLKAMLGDLLAAAVTTKPTPYAALRIPDAAG